MGEQVCHQQEQRGVLSDKESRRLKHYRRTTGHDGLQVLQIVSFGCFTCRLPKSFVLMLNRSAKGDDRPLGWNTGQDSDS